MASVKISQLPAATTPLTGTELLETVQGGASRRVAVADVVPVQSVHGRTGDVAAAASDYDASQVDNDSGVTGASVADALDQLATNDGVNAAAAAAATAAVAADLATLDGEVAALVTGVSSVHGRSGAVVAAASDYDASQVDNDSGVTGATVSDALETLDAKRVFSLADGFTRDLLPTFSARGVVVDGGNVDQVIPLADGLWYSMLIEVIVREAVNPTYYVYRQIVEAYRDGGTAVLHFQPATEFVEHVGAGAFSVTVSASGNDINVNVANGGSVIAGYAVYAKYDTKPLPWTPADLGAKLVQWFSADDTTGSGASLSMPDLLSGNAAAPVGASNAPALATVGDRQVLTFDGTDDYLSTPYITAVGTAANTLGFAGWVKYNQFEDNQTLVLMDPADGSSSSKLFVRTRPGFSSIGAGGGNRRITLTTSVPAGVWHFLTFEFDNTQSGAPTAVAPDNRLRITVNGIEVGWTFTSGTNLATVMPTATGSWRLGGWSAAGPNFSFNGQVSDVYVLTGRLTDAEISRLMAFKPLA